MDRLSERIAQAARAIATLQELSARQNLTLVERDAMLQRFEYSFEATWKTVQLFLRTVEGVEAGAPKGVVRAALRSGLLSDGEARAALRMVDDRNLTVHTYNEPLAVEIAARVPDHAALLGAWLDRLRTRAAAAR